MTRNGRRIQRNVRRKLRWHNTPSVRVARFLMGHWNDLLGRFPFEFAAGTLVAGDKVSFRCFAPTCTVYSLETALTALKGGDL